MVGALRTVVMATNINTVATVIEEDQHLTVQTLAEAQHIPCDTESKDNESVKVRLHGQKFSRTTWYNMVVQHKMCRSCVDGMGDVCCATFYVVRPRL